MQVTVYSKVEIRKAMVPAQGNVITVSEDGKAMYLKNKTETLGRDERVLFTLIRISWNENSPKLEKSHS